MTKDDRVYRLRRAAEERAIADTAANLCRSPCAPSDGEALRRAAG